MKFIRVLVGLLLSVCSAAAQTNTFLANDGTFKNAVTSSGVDTAFGTTRGSVLERGAAGWAGLPPGSAGLPLVSAGPGGDPLYQAVPLVGGGLGGSQLGATANQIPVFPGGGGAASPTSAPTWFDSVYCNTVGFLIVRTTGAWTCSRSIEANAQWWGATPDNGVTDNCIAFTNAYNAITAAGNNALHIPFGQYGTTCFPTITGTAGNSFTIRGDGMFSATGTLIRDMNTTNNLITVSNSQHVIIENLYFFPLVRKTAGFQIAFSSGSFYPWVHHVRIDYGYNGISIINTSGSKLEYVTENFMLGAQGIFYGGTNGNGSFGADFDHYETNNPYPVRAITFADIKTWAQSTGFSSGQVIVNNGNIYQVTANCTSSNAGTGPAGFPAGSTPDSVFSGTIADGTCAWKFVSTNNLTWVAMDSFANSLTMYSCALLNGAISIAMTDSANTGSSFPQFLVANGGGTDHPFTAGYSLQGGNSVLVSNGFIGSTLNGAGLDINTAHKGEVLVSNSRVEGSSGPGILVNTTTAINNIFNGNVIANNSAGTSAGLNPGVSVAANVNHQIITNNRIGVNNQGGNNQGFGVTIAAGTGNFLVVKNNDLQGNVNGAISNGATGTNNVIEGNTPAQPWTAFTPSFACGTATITNNSSLFKNADRVTYIAVDFTITALGSCTAGLTFNLPLTSSTAMSFVGRDGAVSGKTAGCANGVGAAIVTCSKADNTNFAVNERFQLTGTYGSTLP